MDVKPLEAHVPAGAHFSCFCSLSKRMVLGCGESVPCSGCGVIYTGVLVGEILEPAWE